MAPSAEGEFEDGVGIREVVNLEVSDSNCLSAAFLALLMTILYILVLGRVCEASRIYVLHIFVT